MSARPILLLLGAGKFLGTEISAVFAQAGYKVVLVARSHQEGLQSNGYYYIKADLGDPEAIPRIFQKTKQEVGVPTVVVYNAGSYGSDDIADPFSSLAPSKMSQFHTTIAVNGTSPLLSLDHAIEAFRSLNGGNSAGKTFILSGNLLYQAQFKNRLVFGLGKTMCAYGIRFASITYAGQGIRFYYADERSPKGLAVMRDVDGQAAGLEYLKLVQTPQQLPRCYTYVKNEGYRAFREGDYLATTESEDPYYVLGSRFGGTSKPQVASE